MPPISLGGLTHWPNSSSRAEPSMIMPLPKTSCACATVPFSPGTTRCFSNPKALHNHSIAAFASRYRIAGMTVDTVFWGLLGILSSSAGIRALGRLNIDLGQRRSAGSLPWLQPLFDHIQEALPDRIPFRGGESAERPVREQHGKPAHRGPRQVFRAWPTLGGQHAGVDEPVECGAQQLKGIEAAIPGLGRNWFAARFVGDREGGVEQSRFFLGKAQVSGANRSQARASGVGGTGSTGQPG